MGVLKVNVSPKSIEWGHSFNVDIKWNGDYTSPPNPYAAVPPLNDRKIQLVVSLVFDRKIISQVKYSGLDPISFEKQIMLTAHKSKMPVYFYGEKKAEIRVVINGYFYYIKDGKVTNEGTYLTIAVKSIPVYLRKPGYKPKPAKPKPQPEPDVDNPIVNPIKSKESKEVPEQPTNEEDKKYALIALSLAAISAGAYFILMRR